MALDILHDNWGPYTHTEVENAIKAYLTVLENRINQAIQSGGVGLADLSAEVQALLAKANTALQPENIAAWAKAQNKPGYTVSEITGVEGYQNLLAKLQDMDAKIQAAAASGGVDPDDEMSSTSENVVQNKVIKAYVDAAVLTLQNALNALMNGQSVTDAIDTFNEVVAFLNGIDTDDPTLFNQLKNLSDAITALQTAIAGVYTKSESDGRYVAKNGTDSLMSEAEHTKLAGIAAGAEVNKIEGIIVNGTEATPDQSTRKVSINVAGEKGDDGITPHIGQNGNWWVGPETNPSNDTGKPAQGPAGDINLSEGETPTLTIVQNLITDDDEQDNIKVLSAGMGKLLFQLITQVSQSAGGVSVSHSQGVTNIVIGGGGGSALPTTASPTISVTDSGVNKLVTITNDAEETGAAIYYTTDGTEPTIQSTRYTEPFVFSTEGTSTIKAVAVSNGKLPSASATEEVVIAPFWTDGVIFSNSAGATIEDEDMSVSGFMPLSGGGYVWVWNGVPLAKSNSRVTLAIYDEDKNYLGGFLTVNLERIYNVAATYNNKNTAYIRIAAATAEKSRVIVKKLANNTAGSTEGEFLYRGSAITNDYAMVSPMSYFKYNPSADGSLIRSTVNDSVDSQQQFYHYAALPMMDISKYSSITVKHYTAQPVEQKHILVLTFNANDSYADYWQNYVNATPHYPDPRTWPGNVDGKTKIRLQINGMYLHDCYVKGTWTEDGETKTEYLFKGANVE